MEHKESECIEISNQASQDIAAIFSKEPVAARALSMIISHIASTYNDKYADGEKTIDTKKMLYDVEHGSAINSYQVCRYLQRYNTKGHSKSGLIKDLEKAAHYIVIEITRRLLNDAEVNEQEPKV